MSLEAIESELQNQIEDLPKFASLLRKRAPPQVNQSKMVFTGSGDSYATALFAQGLSNGVVESSDPGELSLQPERARNKYVFLVSVSGRTRASVDLARKLKRFARKRIAITANHNSPLVEVCDGELLLQFRSSGVLTSGTVSFTTSLLAVAYLLGRLPRKLSLGPAIKRSACKVQEILGETADAMFPEQLGHAKLFSIDRKNDAVFCLSGSGKDPARRVSQALMENGFRTHSVTGQSRNIVVRSLETSFYLQNLALGIARKRGLNECRFLTDRSKLMLSNKLIY